jgi:hypothetical protein
MLFAVIGLDDRSAITDDMGVPVSIPTWMKIMTAATKAALGHTSLKTDKGSNTIHCKIQRCKDVRAPNS